MTKNYWVIGLLALCLSGQCLAAGSPKELSVFSGTMVEMTWPEVKEAAAKKSVILLPISVVEEHGPHLELGPDIYITAAHINTIRDVLVKRGIPTVIAPPYYWGINDVTGRFPGSFTFTPETFRQMLLEIATNLQRWGFEEVYFINDHGDPVHNMHIDRAAKEIREKLKIACYSFNELPRIKNYHFQVEYKHLAWKDSHAGANETRTMLDLIPDHVRMDKINGLPRQYSFTEPLGYVGDPARFAEGNGLETRRAGANHSAERILVFRQSQQKPGGANP